MCGTTEVTFQNHYCKYCACFEKRHPFLLLQLLLHRLLLITSTWRSSSTYSDLVKQPVDRNITWIWVPLHLAYSLLFVDCLFLLYHLLIIIHHPALWNRAHGSQNLAWLSIFHFDVTGKCHNRSGAEEDGPGSPVLRERDVYIPGASRSKGVKYLKTKVQWTQHMANFVFSPKLYILHCFFVELYGFIMFIAPLPRWFFLFNSRLASSLADLSLEWHWAMGPPPQHVKGFNETKMGHQIHPNTLLDLVWCIHSIFLADPPSEKMSFYLEFLTSSPTSTTLRIFFRQFIATCSRRVGHPKR